MHAAVKGSCRWNWRNWTTCCRGLLERAWRCRGWAARAAEAAPAGRAEARGALAFADLVKRNWRRTAGGFGTGYGKYKQTSTWCANSGRCGAKRATRCRWALWHWWAIPTQGNPPFNALSRAEVLVSSRMFATLDPTVRALRLPSNRRVLISDTVGFIRDLPKGLLTAFRATLEEVQEAALILHVSDVSNPHHDELDEAVEKILSELGVNGRPRLRVLNKMDQLSVEDRKIVSNGTGGKDGQEGTPVLVSALTGEGIEELLRRMDAEMPTDPVVTLSMRLPLAEGRTLALVHALGRVLHSEVEDSHMRLDAEVPESIAKRLRLNDFAVKGTFRRTRS